MIFDLLCLALPRSWRPGPDVSPGARRAGCIGLAVLAPVLLPIVFFRFVFGFRSALRELDEIRNRAAARSAARKPDGKPADDLYPLW